MTAGRRTARSRPLHHVLERTGFRLADPAAERARFQLTGRAPERARSRAFSLLELLVSMTILSLLLVMLLGMVNAASALWRDSENRVDSYREARAALNVIAADLGGIFTTTNPACFVIDPAEGLPGTAAPQDTANSVFFLSAQSKDAQDPDAGKSDLCETGYFLAFDKTTANAPQPSYNLYRFFRSSDATFDSIRKNQFFRDMTSSPASGEEILARYVTDFNVTAFTLDPTTGAATPFVQSAATPTPDVLEISLTAINKDTAAKFKSRADWTKTSAPIHQQSARTFSTRIHLRPPSSASATPSPSPSPTP